MTFFTTPVGSLEKTSVSGRSGFRAAFIRGIFPAILSGVLFITPANSRQINPLEMNFPDLYSRSAEGFIVIAHRGASYDYPENTMLAFEKALEMGADMIELDVTLSRDGVPVVFHDARLDEKTDTTGVMSDYTLEEIRALDAGKWFGLQFTGELIPTLEEVLAWAAGKIALNIEIKSEAVTETDNAADGVEGKVIDLVYQYGMEKHVIISSFSYSAITRLSQLDPAIPTGLLYNDRLANPGSVRELVENTGADAFHCHWRELGRDRRIELQAAGIPVLVYTVNTRGRMRRLIRQGVTGIFTDRPDLLRDVAVGVIGTD